MAPSGGWHRVEARYETPEVSAMTVIACCDPRVDPSAVFAAPHGAEFDIGSATLFAYKGRNQRFKPLGEDDAERREAANA